MRLVKINRLYVNFFKNRRFLSTMSKALVLLSDGAEEMETVISVDVLRRGEVSGFEANCLPFELLPLIHRKFNTSITLKKT